MTPNMPTKMEGNGAQFRQLEAVSLTEGVVAALKDAFFSGMLKPGVAIVERQIGKQMNVGTPVVREALISLRHEGFVRRIKNKGTFVTAFDAEEVRQLYTLRTELETLALQWARPLATRADIEHLRSVVDRLVEAGERGNRRQFLECDFEFHSYCWSLSRNTFLAETLARLMSPLSAFVVLASNLPLTSSMAKEHYLLVDALASMTEPEFSATVRKAFSDFAIRWTSATSHLRAGAGAGAAPQAEDDAV
jgi:DNA-binding GntR family transcriptional regulator